MKKLKLFSGEISIEDRLNEVLMGYEMMFNVELSEKEIEIFKQAYKMGIQDGEENQYIKIIEQT